MEKVQLRKDLDRPGYFWWESVLSGLFLSGALLAQAPPPEPASRQDAISALQAQKAKDIRPPEVARAEGLVRRFEELFLIDPSGFFPSFDSIYPGGGLTFGAGYRQFYGDNTFWQVRGLYSL